MKINRVLYIISNGFIFNTFKFILKLNITLASLRVDSIRVNFFLSDESSPSNEFFNIGIEVVELEHGALIFKIQMDQNKYLLCILDIFKFY